MLLTIYANIAGKVFKSVNFIHYVQFTEYLTTVLLAEGGSLLKPGPALAYLATNCWQIWGKVFPCDNCNTHHTLCCSWNSLPAAAAAIVAAAGSGNRKESRQRERDENIVFKSEEKKLKYTL